MADPLSWAIHKIRQINDFIWHTSMSDISKGKSFIIKQLRIIVLAARGFYVRQGPAQGIRTNIVYNVVNYPFRCNRLWYSKGFCTRSEASGITDK